MWEGWVPWCGAGPGLGVVAVTSWGTGDAPSMSTPVGCIQGWGSGKGWLCLLPRQGKACSRHTQKPPAIPSNPVSLPCRVGVSFLGPDCRHRTGKDSGDKGRVFWPSAGVLRCWAVWLSQNPALSSGCHDATAATHLPGLVLAAV